MKKILLSLMIVMNLLLFCSLACADGDKPVPQIIFNLSADKWVTSKTANVTVAVHALLTAQQLADAQKNVLESLQKISNAGEWKITQIQRTQNQANLEQLEITAEARLPNDALNDLRRKTKDVSKQGENYEIQSIDYSPTNDEITNTQADLRQEIYQLAKNELKQLNEIYPNQNYYLFGINFNNVVSQSPQPMYQKAFVTQSTDNNQPASESANNVSQHLTLSGEVTLSMSPQSK